MENLLEVDKQVFLFFNHFAGTFFVFDDVIKLVVNEYFITVGLALIIVYMWFSKKNKKEVVVISFLSVSLVNLLISVSNQLVDRPRPFDDLNVNLLFYRPTDPSFPSNAAAVGFALAAAIFLYNRKLGIGSVILAVLYSFSRMYAGVHYPSDIIVGALLGVLSVLFISQFKKLVLSLTVLLEGLQRKLRLEIK